MKLSFQAIIVFILLTNLLHAQNLPKFSGLMFGDYFYNLNHHNSAEEGMNGFQFRRIFITADYSISEKFNSRFRIEADNISLLNTTASKMNMWVKDAYLEWIDIFEGSSLFVGVSPTPAFEISTRIWNHRFLEKTILDYNGIVSSRDMGMDLRGKLLSDGKIKYWFKIGNNANAGPENNKQKRFYGLLEFYPLNDFIITLYGDFTTLSSIYDKFSNSTKKTKSYVLTLFCNYKYNSFSAGLETLFRNIKNGFQNSAQLTDLHTYGISLWAYYNLNNKFTLVSRYDFYDNNSKIHNDDYSLIILAFDYKPAARIHFAPNVEWKTYKNGSCDDVIPRLTFFWEF